MNVRLPLLLSATLLMGAGGQLLAQAPAAPAGPKNLLRNGNMEAKPRIIDNTYDGIDKTGTFKAGLISVKVLGASGQLSERRMPPSVALEDMNRDGKVDVVAALPEGFIYVYFNQGEGGSPKFGNAEILPLFYSRVNRAENEFVDGDIWYDRRVPRIGLGEWSKPGGIDIVMGNLFGQLMHIKAGSNSSNQVSYTMVKNKDSVEIPTTKIPGRYWGNLFSPLIIDWDGDGKKDIVMGEGSYSANSVFLMHNKSGSTPPKFTEEDRHFLVTGDGREQLIPALADYNGDGRVDVLVADREGRVSVHLRPENWKIGDTLPESSFLTIGGKDKRGQAITIGTGDLNKDGLFDIIMGESSGVISIAYNTGTPQEPKFATLDPLKGVDVWGENMSQPPSWEFYDGSGDGNALGYAKVVTAEDDPNSMPPEGKQCVFLGNFAPLNKIVQPGPTPNMAEQRIEFRLRQSVNLEHNAKYNIELNVKGAKVTELSVYMEGWVRGTPPAKVDMDDRGGVAKNQQVATETWKHSAKFTTSGDWRNQTQSFVAKLKDPRLKEHKSWGSRFDVIAVLNAQDSNIYIDDVKFYKVE